MAPFLYSIQTFQVVLEFFVVNMLLFDSLANVSSLVAKVQVNALMCGSMSFSKRWHVSRRISLASPAASQSDSSTTPLVSPPLEEAGSGHTVREDPTILL